MKVLDFINEHVDTMNETDFFEILNRLADSYADSLAQIGVRSGEEIQDSALLSGFLLQEIEPLRHGGFVLAKQPNIHTLRYLNSVVKTKEV